MKSPAVLVSSSLDAISCVLREGCDAPQGGFAPVPSLTERRAKGRQGRRTKAESREGKTPRRSRVGFPNPKGAGLY